MTCGFFFGGILLGVGEWGFFGGLINWGDWGEVKCGGGEIFVMGVFTVLVAMEIILILGVFTFSINIAIYS